MKDPLVALIDALEARRDVPFEWVIAHVQNGSIQTVWNKCKDPRTLLRVYAFTGDAAGVVRGAAACVRTVLKYVSGDTRPRAAVDTVEAWLRGQATRDDLERVAYVASTMGPPAVSYAIYAASHLAVAAIQSGQRNVGERVVLAIDAAASAHAADAFQPFQTTQARVIRDFVTIVRQTIPCPTLDQLMSRTA